MKKRKRKTEKENFEHKFFLLVKENEEKRRKSGRVKEVTFVTAFAEERGDNLSSRIVCFDQQNPQRHPRRRHLISSPLLRLHLHLFLTTHHHFFFTHPHTNKTLISQQTKNNTLHY